MTDPFEKTATRLTDRDFLDERDPFALFSSWLAAAEAHEPDNHNAMTLATVDSAGLPDARIVLLKEMAGDGFVFFTNTLSAKGRELTAAPKAALVFHWKSLNRQIRARGDVETVSAAEADAYFATRPRGAQIGAHASQQSDVMPTRDALKRRVAEIEAFYAGKDVPRPSHWSGYRLVPSAIEFWADRPFRLHDRLVFTRENSAETWTRRQLYP